MFRDHPGLEGREEQRRGDAAEHAPEHQQSEVGRVLEHVDHHLEHTVERATSLSSQLCCEQGVTSPGEGAVGTSGGVRALLRYECGDEICPKQRQRTWSTSHCAYGR